MFFQDIPHSLPADVFDAEFTQLADDRGVTESRRLRDFDCDCPHFAWLSLAAFGVRGFRLVAVRFPEPPQER
ncbi:hypothetical protein [Rubinisphaera margarita]|uniref:hypothetical protein n=1 Tax=Rubinisphaera margarita TaxID=2909586 RepID=UPI001EE852B8|nr:hypothetical protein [Rubinisphaera margarita]MCG6154639.1 hypothetical protein [Rubinisphaera margarita]